MSFVAQRPITESNRPPSYQASTGEPESNRHFLCWWPEVIPAFPLRHPLSRSGLWGCPNQVRFSRTSPLRIHQQEKERSTPHVCGSDRDSELLPTRQYSFARPRSFLLAPGYGSRELDPFNPAGFFGAQLQAPTTVIFRADSVPKPARPLGPLLLFRQPCGRMQTHRWHLLRLLRYVGAHSCCLLCSRTPSKPRRPH